MTNLQKDLPKMLADWGTELAADAKDQGDTKWLEWARNHYGYPFKDYSPAEFLKAHRRKIRRHQCQTT